MVLEKGKHTALLFVATSLTRLCSEAQSSPHLRLPPLKDNRMPKLISAIVLPA